MSNTNLEFAFTLCAMYVRAGGAFDFVVFINSRLFAHPLYGIIIGLSEPLIWTRTDVLAWLMNLRFHEYSTVSSFAERTIHVFYKKAWATEAKKVRKFRAKMLQL